MSAFYNFSFYSFPTGVLYCYTIAQMMLQHTGGLVFFYELDIPRL